MRKGTQRAHLTRAKKHQLAFLDGFAATGTVQGAAGVAGVHRRTHYKWIETDPEYAAAFEDARETLRDAIREEIHRRAVTGWQEPVVYQGQIQYYRDKKGKPIRPVTVTKFSDRLLELHAKAHCPEYRDKHEITGPAGGPVQVQVVYTGVPQPEITDKTPMPTKEEPRKA